MKQLTGQPAVGSWYYIRSFYIYHTNWIIGKVLKSDPKVDTTIVREYIDLAKFIKYPRTEKLATHAAYWTTQECLHGYESLSQKSGTRCKQLRKILHFERHSVSQRNIQRLEKCVCNRMCNG